MSGRPEFLSNEDLLRWENNIDNDANISDDLKNNPIIREVCLAGLYLCEELEKLGCSEDKIVKIQFTAGKLSFGRDPWEVHQSILENFELNELVFEPEPVEWN